MSVESVDMLFHRKVEIHIKQVHLKIRNHVCEVLWLGTKCVEIVDMMIHRKIAWEYTVNKYIWKLDFAYLHMTSRKGS